jgi:hypothetical protein
MVHDNEWTVSLRRILGRVDLDEDFGVVSCWDPLVCLDQCWKRAWYRCRTYLQRLWRRSARLTRFQMCPRPRLQCLPLVRPSVPAACHSHHATIDGVPSQTLWLSHPFSCALLSHRCASLTGVHLSQVCISHRRASLTGVHLSQACISHRRAFLTDVHLSQACISRRRASLTGVHLSQACIIDGHLR